MMYSGVLVAALLAPGLAVADVIPRLLTPTASGFAVENVTGTLPPEAKVLFRVASSASRTCVCAAEDIALTISSIWCRQNNTVWSRVFTDRNDSTATLRFAGFVSPLAVSDAEIQFYTFNRTTSALTLRSSDYVNAAQTLIGYQQPFPVVLPAGRQTITPTTFSLLKRSAAGSYLVIWWKDASNVQQSAIFRRQGSDFVQALAPDPGNQISTQIGVEPDGSLAYMQLIYNGQAVSQQVYRWDAATKINLALPVEATSLSIVSEPDTPGWYLSWKVPAGNGYTQVARYDPAANRWAIVADGANLSPGLTQTDLGTASPLLWGFLFNLPDTLVTADIASPVITPLVQAGDAIQDHQIKSFADYAAHGCQLEAVLRRDDGTAGWYHFSKPCITVAPDAVSVQISTLTGDFPDLTNTGITASVMLGGVAYAPTKMTATSIEFSAPLVTAPTQMDAQVVLSLSTSAGRKVAGNTVKLTVVPVIVPPPVVTAITKVWPAATLPATFAPGDFVTLWGAAFASAVAQADVPYPAILGGIKVTLRNSTVSAEAVLQYVSTGQLNVQLPMAAAGAYSLSVTSAYGASPPYPITLTDTSPNFYLWPSDGTLVLTGPDGALVTSANLPKAGDIVDAYATGCGESTPPVAAGSAAFAYINAPLQVLLGSQPATGVVGFLDPQYPGLCRIRFTVPPPQLPSGDVTFTVGNSVVKVELNPNR